jgi:putative membrane protein
MQMAGSSDLYEIESSRTVLASSQSPTVRDFAQMMVDHHTMTNQNLLAAARSAGLQPPPQQLMTKHANMVSALRQAPASVRDASYLRQQATAHQEALMLHRNYAAGGDNAALRTTESQTVPLIQQHISLLTQISQ